MKFTIFTPTYNRAYILPKLYQSLLRQSNKDFEWLVIDDGSTDNTESLVQKYINENKIPIRYYIQENQGKHIAINKALNLANGEYLVTVDSDDYIVDNHIEICKKLTKKIDKDNHFAGFTYVHLPIHLYNPQNHITKEWTTKGSYKWGANGEMHFVLKTAIAKKYPFPIYEGEKFCQESVFLIPILQKYDFLFTNYVLVHGDYLEDGLSHNVYKKLLKNPRYAMLSFKRKLSYTSNYKEKLIIIESYYDIANKTGGGYLKNILKIPFFWTIIFFIFKIIKKIKK